MNELSVPIFRHEDEHPRPGYGHKGDSGLDTYAAKTVWVPPFGMRYVPLGIAVALPEGLEVQVRPRSSSTGRGWISPIGTIDSGYRGEIAAPFFNMRPWPRRIKKGERCSQIVVCYVKVIRWDEVPHEDALPSHLRGRAGFGSTGR